MQTYNPYLKVSPDNKGGGLYLEDPAAVQNIALQTAAASPDSFESCLADELMSVFAAGIWELEAVASELNARECVDRAGARWTAALLQTQLAQSASLLFVADERVP